jgi:hypothetical protein
MCHLYCLIIISIKYWLKLTKHLFKLMYTAHKIIWEFLRSKMVADLPSGLIGHVTLRHLLTKNLVLLQMSAL